MKYLLHIFIILFIFSCAKNKENLTSENLRKPENDNYENKNNLNKQQKNIYFGKNGSVSLNTETDEYVITSIPENLPDISIQLPFSLIFDSQLTDSVYNTKSSLFPANKYSLFKIPEIIPFDKELSVESRPGIGKYVTLQISGNIGNKKNISYYICYNTENYKHAKFNFVIQETDDFYSYPICEKYEKLINNSIVTPLNIAAGDYMFLNVLMFRAYAKGECYPGVENCKIYFKTDIKYYLSLSSI
ncbi:hypothetical protein [Spirobacillus cienkowskii]|uniref:hypothetical protein n=1 Tax=Spirobacillus cienkowskii TaxID=495820 RepID=UPI0030D51647